MDFIDIAKTRYTTKKYDALKKITEAEITNLQEILRLSPSSINSQPWKFIFVSDDKIKNQLAEASYFNAPKVQDASHLVVFSAINDLPRFEAQIQKHLPEGAVGYYQQFIKPMPEAEIKAWLQHQVYLSLGYFLSACASMQIDATPMEGIQPEAYNRILNLEHHTTLFAVAIGYRDPNDVNQPHLKAKSRLPLEEVVERV